jgi:hypothetical protein
MKNILKKYKSLNEITDWSVLKNGQKVIYKNQEYEIIYIGTERGENKGVIIEIGLPYLLPLSKKIMYEPLYFKNDVNYVVSPSHSWRTDLHYKIGKEIYVKLNKL